MKSKLPSHYKDIKSRYPDYLKAVEALGELVKAAGPLDKLQAELIQLGAAVAIRSEGAVHSHARRARDNGASREHIEHAILLLTSTVGFPAAMAALSWAREIYED